MGRSCMINGACPFKVGNGQVIVSLSPLIGLVLWDLYKSCWFIDMKKSVPMVDAGLLLVLC